MKITELLVESQQLDEGPFTQAVGKVGGKIAKGIANVGKDLKAGFKAGYSGEQPPADAAATSEPTTTDPAASTAAATDQTAPVKKAAPAKAAATDTTDPETTPAAKPASAAADTTGTDVAAVKKELDDFLATYRKDLDMQNKNWEFVTPKVNALEKQVADLIAAGSAAAAEVPAAEPETKRRGGKVAGELSQSASAVRRREQRARGKAKPTQAQLDAEREARIGNFTDAIERHKQRMVAEGLANGSIKIFKR
jgi:hypothetical protein